LENLKTYLAQRRNPAGIQVAENRKGKAASSRPDFLDRIYAGPTATSACSRIYSAFLATGGLNGTRLSFDSAVDQGIEHSGGASFAKKS